MRVGHGYDVHRLVEGRKLILGGVEIPWEKGLLGHSDADVLLHALMDAILGADSLQLLAEVSRLLTEAGYRLVNVDCTILAQRPKLMPHVPAMRANIARVLGVELDAVSVKATTEEGLGFTGDGSGIAAHAVVLIERR